MFLKEIVAQLSENFVTKFCDVLYVTNITKNGSNIRSLFSKDE